MAISGISMLLCILLLAGFEAVTAEKRFQSESTLLLPTPEHEVKTEVGSLLTWPQDTPALRHFNGDISLLKLRSGGMFTPMYGDVDSICYVSQGHATAGLLHPSGTPTNVRYLATGDVLAIPSGWVSWLWNSADREFRSICIGNPHGPFRKYQSFYLRNVLRGFSKETLGAMWDLEEEEVRRIKGMLESQKSTAFAQIQQELGPLRHNDMSGNYAYNMRTSRPDISVRAGWMTMLNANKLKVLKEVDMGAMMVGLSSGAMSSPQWMKSQGQLMHVIKGEGRAQIISLNGDLMLNEVLKEGDFFVVPAMHPYVLMSGDASMEVICLHIGEDVTLHQLAGSRSELRGIPAELLAASFNSTLKTARQIQTGRLHDDTIFFWGARSQEQEGRSSMSKPFRMEQEVLSILTNRSTN